MGLDQQIVEFPTVSTEFSTRHYTRTGRRTPGSPGADPGAEAGGQLRGARNGKEEPEDNMAKPSTVMILANRMAREIIANQTKARLMMGFDAALIAANRSLKLGPGRAAAFAEAYHEAIEELADMFIVDADENGDKDLAYSKGKRDEVIRRIVGEENFLPFELSYGEAYMDELKRVRILEEKTGAGR